MQVMSVMIMSDNVSNTYFTSVFPPGGGGGGGTLLNGNLCIWCAPPNFGQCFATDHHVVTM